VDSGEPERVRALPEPGSLPATNRSGDRSTARSFLAIVLIVVWSQAIPPSDSIEHGSSTPVLKFFIVPRLFARRLPIALAFALALYAALGLGGIQNMGVVGEVAWSWMDGRANLHQPVSLQTHDWGPFTASSTRPMETFSLGNIVLPIAINGYTGGLADWPSRLLSAAGIGYESTMFAHWLLGAIFIVLVHRFVRLHGSAIAANAAALLLASDWGFVFFRRALGGTEVLLQASVLLCLWALWSRRWAGGRHGLTAFALGVGIGVSAKLTFFLSLIPLVITARLLRWDKPRLRPPLPDRWAPIVLALLVPLLPLIVMWIHHSWVGLPTLQTHDHLGFQFERVWSTLSGGPIPARETTAALFSWLGNPSSFLHTAWQADAPPPFSPLRCVGWLLVLMGSILAWRDIDDTPRIALTRFCSVFLLLQVASIWMVARDLHHLAIATPTMAILAGLSIELIAARTTPPRSLLRSIWVTVGCLPWVGVGSYAITQTDSILQTIPRPTVDRAGQEALITLLQRNGVQRVLTVEYESAGSLDVLAPEVDFIHGWTTAVQRPSTALSELLPTVMGHHLLVINNAPPWSYNLRPQVSDLDAAGAQVGAVLEAADRLPDDAAVLYTVDSRMGRP